MYQIDNQIETRQSRRIQPTQDLAMPPVMSGVTAVVVPETGAGTFGGLVDRHWFPAGLLGMAACGALITSETATLAVLLAGPAAAATGLVAAMFLERQGRLQGADVAMAVAATAGVLTLLAVWLGGSLAL